MRLYLTYCSNEKNPVASGTPGQIYSARRTIKFIRTCKSKGLDWAILSAKYGLFFPDDIRDNYDVTFKTISGKCRIVEDEKLLSREESAGRLNALIEEIRNQMNNRKIESIAFFANKPLARRKCYMLILHAAVDHCNIHMKWNEIVEHIIGMYKDGKGRIRLITSLDEI